MILLDSHVAAWLAFEPAQISQKAQIAIREARESGEGLALCDITLLELAMAARKGRLRVDIDIELFIADLELRFRVLPITAKACARALALPASFPKDPADRIIGATALVERVPLITADRAIQRSRAVPTIW